MKIKIPFNAWSYKRLKFEKCATSRNKKYGEVGDTFFVGYTKYKIDLVTKLPLWFIAKELYESEGVKNELEFMKVWVIIHPVKGFVPYQEVWYHHFYKSEEL